MGLRKIGRIEMEGDKREDLSHDPNAGQLMPPLFLGDSL